MTHCVIRSFAALRFVEKWPKFFPELHLLIYTRNLLYISHVAPAWEESIGYLARTPKFSLSLRARIPYRTPRFLRYSDGL